MTALIITFILLLVVGAPIFFAVGISASAFVLSSGSNSLAIITQKMVDGIVFTTLMALPLFIYSGNLMSCGATQRLMRFADMILGKIPGGLGTAACGGAAFFGSVSGSAVATSAAIGSIMGPEMVDRGYKPGYAASLMAGAGAMGAIIPPSICFVVYASITGASVTKMLTAGIFPGLSVVLGLIILNCFISAKRGYGKSNYKYTAKEVLTITLQAIPALAMPVFVLGSIMSGIATATEAAAISVIYAFLLAAFAYGEMNFKQFVEITKQSAMGTAFIFIIIPPFRPLRLGACKEQHTHDTCQCHSLNKQQQIRHHFPCCASAHYTRHIHGNELTAHSAYADTLAGHGVDWLQRCPFRHNPVRCLCDRRLHPANGGVPIHHNAHIEYQG